MANYDGMIWWKILLADKLTNSSIHFQLCCHCILNYSWDLSQSISIGDHILKLKGHRKPQVKSGNLNLRQISWIDNNNNSNSNNVDDKSYFCVLFLSYEVFLELERTLNF